MSAALTQPAPARPFLAVSRRWFSHTGTDCRTQTQLLLCSSSPNDSPGPAPGSRRTVTAPSPPPGPLLRLSTDTGPGGPGPLRADGKGRPGGRGGAVVPVGATRGPTSGATEAAPARDGPRGSSPAPTLRGCGRSSQTPLRPGRTARRLGPKAADRTGRGPSSLADPAPPPARSRRRRLTSLFRTMPRARRRPMPLSAPSSSATPARLISSFPPPGPGPGPGPDIPALAAAEQARLDCAAAAPPAPPRPCAPPRRCDCTETAVYCELRVRADHRGPADHGSARAREPRPPLGAAAWPGLKAPPLGAARRRPCRRIPRGLRPSAPLAQQGGSPAPRRGCAGSSALSPAPRRGCTGSCVAQRRLYRQGRRRSPAQGRRRGGPALVNSRR